jgi:ATP-dependent RNA helicase DeaD
MEEFKKLGLSENSLNALEKKGFTKPTSIQAKVIPLLLEGKKDVVGQSQTGTGKTASFALPILEKIQENARHVQAIILTPTRELAIQVAKEIGSLKGKKDIKIMPVYGGSSISPQIKELKRNSVDIVVGTPGRVMDLQRRRALRIDNIEYAVLDEADEMLNMGFVDDIEDILESTPKNKKMLLFSATMPRAILKIAKKYMKDYEFIEVEKKDLIINTVEQVYYDIKEKNKLEGLQRILDYHLDFHGIIFCNRKATVDKLVGQLPSYNAAALHGDMTQSSRENILEQFRARKVKVLIATDVAARGIDVNDLTHVINFALPQSPEAYVHRIGRTGRAGKKGIAITFVVPSERRKLGFIEKINDCRIKKLEFPTAAEIVKHKEAKIKTLIQEVISGKNRKHTKYDTMAEELLKEYEASEVISAILSYSFKHELNISSYRDISASSEKTPSDYRRDKNRSRQRPDKYKDKKWDKKKKFSGRSKSGNSHSDRSYGDRSEKKFSGKKKFKSSKKKSFRRDD